MVQGADVSYTSEDVTSDNDLVIDESGSEIRFYDPQADAGIQSSCRPGRVDSAGNPIEVFCPKSGLRNVNVDLGPNEDKLTANVSLVVTASGGSGVDVLTSFGAGADLLVGAQGNDTLAGGPGNDSLDGGDGNDVLRGEAGDDRIAGGAGTDVFEGGDGADMLSSRDGLAERVSCAAGADVAEADTADEVAVDCETVQRMFVAPPEDTGGGADTTRPKVAVGGASVQRISTKRRRIYVAATSSERGEIAASGYIDLSAARIPLRSRAATVSVAGGGVEIALTLTTSQARKVLRELRGTRRRRAVINVSATDRAGNTATARAWRVTLRR